MEQELIQLVALPLLAASLPPVNASNTGRRQWLSYFGVSTVEGYDCLVFAGCIERNGCGNHRHSNDDPKHNLLFHDRLPEALAVDYRADGWTEDNQHHQTNNWRTEPLGARFSTLSNRGSETFGPASKRWPDVAHWHNATNRHVRSACRYR
jgi:hypothetical protein